MNVFEVPKGYSNYFETLDVCTKERYIAKISLISDIDPYNVKDWKSDPGDFPSIAYPDIVNYLIFAKSAYTLQELKAYKSLESYNQFVCGWVKDVKHKTINDKSVITARVLHSQRLNATPLKPWIIAEKDGTVLSAHCDCMAGLGEACSHVGAVLFYVDGLVKQRDSKTVTQEAAYWMLPSGVQKVSYEMVKDINFKSSRAMQKDLSVNIDHHDFDRICTPRRQLASMKLPNVPEPTESERANFFRILNKSDCKPVVLSLTKEYAPNFIPTCLGNSFPKILSDLYNEDMTQKTKEEIYAHCENIFKISK